MITHSQALFVAWQCATNRAIYPVARLVESTGSPKYEFVYITGVHEAIAHGFTPFAGMKALDRVYQSNALFPLFGNRVMSKSRGDFGQYVERLGLEGEPEPILVLARSEGRKVTDNLEVFTPPQRCERSEDWLYMAFVRGVRHVEGAEEAVASLSNGDQLLVTPEPTNEWSANAILMLSTEDSRLGYVPHALVEDINRLIDMGGRVSGEVVRVNAPPSPVHQRLLVRIRAQNTKGFQPLATPRYEPIPASAQAFQIGEAVKPR